MRAIRSTRTFAALAVSVALISLPATSTTQTTVKPGRNFFSIQQDIEFGRQAASEIERQIPMVNDPVVQEWIDGLGYRLAQRTTMPNLPWRFRVANSADINAFALPGGFVYINRGLVQITQDESEIAGVVGHEMAHVTLRHGTSQLSKQMLYQTPLAILGSLGGLAGAIGQIGGGLVLPIAFLKFSRGDEKDADIVGVQTMVAAGYDPEGMVRVFEKLQQAGGGRGAPEWLSSHPNPDNRIERIRKEVALLNMHPSARPSSASYTSARNRLGSMSAAPRVSPRSGSTRREPATRSRAGEPPSRNFQTFRTSSGLFQIGYPDNWQAYSDLPNSVTLAPDWAVEGNEVTHGVIASLLDTRSQAGQLSLNQSFDQLLQQLGEANAYLREEPKARYRGRLAGRDALATFLVGQNNLGTRERVWVVARPAGSGIIYLLFIAPESEFDQYQSAFQTMIRSFAVNE